MPLSELEMYKALNVMSPFTEEAQAQRDGLLLAETFSVRRKAELTPKEMLPYLNTDVPEWASDPMVTKAKALLKEVKSHKGMGQLAYETSLKSLHIGLAEEIQIQLESPNEDTDYIVSELNAILQTK